MENIHDLDQETISSLIDMFNSEDIDNIRMGLAILNNADFTDINIAEFVNQLNNKCWGLHFALFMNNKNEIRARFTYIIVTSNIMVSEKYIIVEDSSDFDSGEWFPYDPYFDLSDEFKFKYK
jgi:hypothetical protein